MQNAVYGCAMIYVVLYNSIAPVAIMFKSAAGMSTFHPNAIS